VQLARTRDGSRIVTSITEIVGLEGDVVSTAELFTRPHGVDGYGPLAPTGVTSRHLTVPHPPVS